MDFSIWARVWTILVQTLDKTWTKPWVNLGQTSGKPQAKPWANLRQTSGRPQADLGQTLGKPQAKPWADLGQTLGKNSGKPWSQVQAKGWGKVEGRYTKKSQHVQFLLSSIRQTKKSHCRSEESIEHCLEITERSGKITLNFAQSIASLNIRCIYPKFLSK